MQPVETIGQKMLALKELLEIRNATPFEDADEMDRLNRLVSIKQVEIDLLIATQISPFKRFKFWLQVKGFSVVKGIAIGVTIFFVSVQLIKVLVLLFNTFYGLW